MTRDAIDATVTPWPEIWVDGFTRGKGKGERPASVNKAVR